MIREPKSQGSIDIVNMINLQHPNIEEKKSKYNYIAVNNKSILNPNLYSFSINFNKKFNK